MPWWFSIPSSVVVIIGITKFRIRFGNDYVLFPYLCAITLFRRPGSS
jgi:hypothetical protein